MDNISTDVTVERHLLTQVYEILNKNNNLCEWYYGHFHNSTISYMDDTVFHCLDIDNIVDNRKIYDSNEK